MMKLKKVLVANRGEIACRVMRTAKRLGLATVAVYSTADREAAHVHAADEAYEIGPAPSAESYLCIDKIIACAQRAGADAIHPGYGFLSENADFAMACAAAGIVFVGPPVEAIAAMGSKSAAKALMDSAGVPIVPGFHGENPSDEALLAAAQSIGFPVLLKAAAGGGGKGMREASSEAEFLDALASAKREAKASFGDDTMLVEKRLIEPRHVEVQIFSDTAGNAVYLFERDCSVQRRHQKVVEEAPAPGIDEALRRQMGEAAVAAARAIAYVGAGTVEFLLDSDGAFYFMEMNTRLQVEHPVTEMITGHDLVEWQLRVAAGENLPCTQEQLQLSGHAMEVRLYAEDPANDFLPATGKITTFHVPLVAHMRLENGVRSGDTIGVHYDPLLAKLVVWGDDRESCRQRLLAALNATVLTGVTTNLDFLKAVIAHPVFATGAVHTGFIDQQTDTLFAPVAAASTVHLAAASLFILLEQQQQAKALAAQSTDPSSPWHQRNAWQLNQSASQVLRVIDGGNELSLPVVQCEGRFQLQLPEKTLSLSGTLNEDSLRISIDDWQTTAQVVRTEQWLDVTIDGTHCRLQCDGEYQLESGEVEHGGDLTAPMPGVIIAVLASTGQTVAADEPLIILEAMKMEHTVRAPQAGTVKTICFAEGEQVDAGAVLLHVEPIESRHAE